MTRIILIDGFLRITQLHQSDLKIEKAQKTTYEISLVDKNINYYNIMHAHILTYSNKITRLSNKLIEI